MDLSVVIVSWNTQELLFRCLESIVGGSRKRIARDVDCGATHSPMDREIIVIDNASTDGSATMVRRRFPEVRLIENRENAGFARANNQAIEMSEGRYVVLLNSDTEVHERALEKLVGFMDEHPEGGAVGPRLLNADGTLQVSCQPMLTPWREFWRLSFLDAIWPRATYPVGRWDGGHPRQVEVLKGACLMLRREALDQVGLLDDRYFMYTEEVDLCFRLREAGWELYWVPTATVTHHGGASTRQAEAKMYVQLYRSKMQFFRKTGGERQARLFKFLLALAYLPRLLVAGVGVPFSEKLAHRAHLFRRLLADLPSM